MAPMPARRAPSSTARKQIRTGKKATKTPSFKDLAPASEAASRAMRGNRATNTRPETLLRDELETRGLRYRTHVADLPGKPDLVFPAARAVVFCDGDFWHGRNWRDLKPRLERRFNAPYWVAKIDRNRRRDRAQAMALRKQGWRVLRYWEGDIRRSPEAVANRIEEALAAYVADGSMPEVSGHRYV